MKMPAESLLEVVLSELRVETFQKENHDEKTCQLCDFSREVELVNAKATKSEELYLLDRLMKNFLESNCHTLPVLVMSGDLNSIIFLARACFVAGLKVGRMENDSKELENLLKL